MSNPSSGVYQIADSSYSHRKFIPNDDFKNTPSHRTLSGSFRTINTGGVTGQPPVVSSSRVRIGENGEWIKKDASNGSFVVYLPQDEAVAAGLGLEEGGLDPVESQRVFDLLNRELSRLLKLHPKEFWRQVFTDESLHAFLESFLKFRTRWFDLPHRRGHGNSAGVIVGEMDLCRRVFMVFYRLSSNQDPAAKASDSLNPKDHGVLLQDLKLLDLPKLLDICAIYGHENEDLTQKLVMNAMKSQPHLHDEFPLLLSHFMTVVQTMNQRCCSRLEVLLNTGGDQVQGYNNLHRDYLEVIDFINDSIVALDSFVNAYKPVAALFSSPIETSNGNEEFLTTLAMLHDSLLPSLRKGFHVIGGLDAKMEKDKGFLLSSFGSLKLLSMRIVDIGWKLLYLCYLNEEFETSLSPYSSTKMFPVNIEDPFVRTDIIIETLRNLASGNRDSSSFIQAIEANHKIMRRINHLLETSWLAMDKEQSQFLSFILVATEIPNTEPDSSTSFRTGGIVSEKDEDAAIMESKISQIKELFPDYGRGFLLACLEAYNHDTEEIIQRILEGTLHDELNSIDVSLENVPSKPPSLISNHDKGKGKLEDLEVSNKNEPVKVSVSGSSTFGRFIRKNADQSFRFETLNSKNNKELAKTSALISQMEYEDEYDDSFDELGMSVGDIGLDDPETEPGSRRERSSGTEGNSFTSGANAKWNSRKNPQFYVKDGKNYSYKVEGSIAVSDFGEAKLVNEAQRELIHGLGRGGNIPYGAVKRLTDLRDNRSDEHESNDVNRERGRGNGRGRGRKGHVIVNANEPGEVQENEGGRGNYRGGGRGRSNYRRGRGMSKHLSGLPGHYT